MNTHRFSVPVSEVERNEQHRAWDIPPDWVQWALAGTEATGTEKIGRLTATLAKNGSQFLVRGSIKVQIQLPCARTLEPAIYDLAPELFLMLRRQQAPQDRPRSRREEHEELLDEDDAAIDTFAGENIELDAFVREQLLLEIPMFPLRSDLRQGKSPATSAPPQSSASVPRLDPRLAPLREIAEKLKAGPAIPEQPGPPGKTAKK